MQIARRALPRLLILVPVALALWMAAGCSSGNAGTPAGTSCQPTLDSIRTQIFDKSCTLSGCHSGSTPAAAMDLGAADLEKLLVNAPAGTCTGIRVVPGHPEQSLLWQKLYSDKPPCGAPMPLGSHLPASELACIRDWIKNLPAGDAGPGCEQCGGTTCVDLQTDTTHCGACDVACPNGSACNAGSCSCSGNLTACGSACVDLEADAKNCGKCGQACPSGALCSAGQCVCPSGLDVCGSACTDTQSDAANCGGCGKSCASGQVCLLGACAAGCGSLTQCGSSCVDTKTSSSNCGACGKKCSLGASCVNGTCACPAGTSDCGGTCINTYSDPSNCGACGKACSSGLVCQAGKCSCANGGSPCGGKCVDTNSDLSNCGGCGVTCGAGQTCTSGKCTCGATGSVSFANQIQPIFSSSCALAGCHKGVKPAEGLNLSAGNAYKNLVGVASKECSGGRLRVAPGDPSQSYIINKLMGVSLCFGTQMPKTGTKLPQSQIDLIGSWICSGAPNN